MANVQETLAKLGKLTDEELDELAENDDRKAVQAAVAKEQDRRAAGEPPPTFDETPSAYDLVGEDGRRILRWHSHGACVEMQGRLSATTGEETTIVSSIPTAVEAAVATEPEPSDE